MVAFEQMPGDLAVNREARNRLLGSCRRVAHRRADSPADPPCKSGSAVPNRAEPSRCRARGAGPAAAAETSVGRRRKVQRDYAVRKVAARRRVSTRMAMIVATYTADTDAGTQIAR